MTYALFKCILFHKDQWKMYVFEINAVKHSLIRQTRNVNANASHDTGAAYELCARCVYAEYLTLNWSGVPSYAAYAHF